MYFSQFIDWTGVLVWNDAVITPSESEFAIGSEATWTQSIFVKLGAAKIFRQSENFWKQLDFYLKTRFTDSLCHDVPTVSEVFRVGRQEQDGEEDQLLQCEG